MFDFAQLKKFFIFALIGSLIVAAIVAVVAVLMGNFNEVTQRVFLTLFMVVIYSLVSLSFIWNDSRRNSFNKLAFFVNTVFILIILSFVASLLGIWEVIKGETIWRLHTTFFLVALAALHGDIVSKASGKEKYMDWVVYANYVFIIVVVALFVPIIFIDDPTLVLGEFYYRILAAAGIIDGTLSILTVIFYKLYMHKHPELQNPARGGRVRVWLWIVAIIVLAPFIISFISGIIIALSRRY